MRKFLVVKSFLVLALVLASTGCSTFLNPFRKEKLIDYNELTYGEDYKNQVSDWAPRRLRLGNDDHDTQSAYSSNRRGPASVAAKEDEIDDPTNEKVRQSVEVSRGQSVANYKRGDRATKEDFWDQAPNDGSLWSNELDGNYFFTKGKVRGMGDIVSIKAEDLFIRQVAEEIKKTLTPAEQEVEMAIYLKNSAGAKDDKDIEAYRAVASDDLKNSDAADIKEKMQKSVRWSQVDLSKAIALNPNDEIRAEVIDKYPNGNFKIKAIKRIIYRGSSKLISLVGVAPTADFDEKDAIASGKLYEYKIKVAR